MKAYEVNFDGLVGPTHNYAGLSYGNLASHLSAHAHTISRPKQAVLEGLEKMWLLMNLGIPQAILPPHPRSNIPMLRTLGFQGSDIKVLEKAKREAPELFYACYSSSNMWAANAGTVSPSSDTEDNRVHISIANLVSHFHRAQEAELQFQIFKKIFADESKFMIHPPLPAALQLGDEGAANHNRFCQNYNDIGVHLFVYGQKGFGNKDLPKRFPARQTEAASYAIARRHRLLGFEDHSRVFFAKQNPHAIDLGVFHNDVISVANQNLFLYHEDAFENTNEVISNIQNHFLSSSLFPFYFIPISKRELSIEEAVASYFFNSQIVSLPNQKMALIAPEECREMEKTNQLLVKIKNDKNPIEEIHFVSCRQSMQNGGGPACLRLRVVLTEEEIKHCLPSIFLNETLYQNLIQWVNLHYRDEISEKDLIDPEFISTNFKALDELTKLLQLGSIYYFQK